MEVEQRVRKLETLVTLLVEYINRYNINNAVNANHHGFCCVDLRKFFIPMGQTMWKPTKTGIALRLNELPTFKQAVDKLHRDNPTIANFTPCFINLDHATPGLIATCPECNPYPSTTA